MQDGATVGNVFGIIPWPQEEPTEEEPLETEGLAGEETETEEAAPAETSSPDSGTTDDGTPPASEGPPEGEAAPEGTAPEGEQAPGEGGAPEAPPLYAGKFRDVSALERGYSELQSEFTRRSQASAEREREIEALQKGFQEQQKLLEALAPVILQQQMAENPELAEQWRQQQALEPLIDQRVAPYRQQVEALQQQQQEEAGRQAMRTNLMGWAALHPEVVPNSPADIALAQTIQVLDLDVADAEQGTASLDLAYEASRDPQLLGVLRVNPHLIDMEGGVEYARQQARLLGPAPVPAQGTQAPQEEAKPTEVQPTPEQRQQARQQAFVETGGTGAPTSGAPGAGKDEFDEAIEEWNKAHSSVFFGGKGP